MVRGVTSYAPEDLELLTRGLAQAPGNTMIEAGLAAVEVRAGRVSEGRARLEQLCAKHPAVKSAGHQYACLAAQASECAAEQGRFWEYHDLLFDNQSLLDRDSLIGYAERVGIARDTFLACLASEAPRQAIARDVAEGMRLGIESTPTFFLNGRTITGAPRADKLNYVIQLERAARQRGEG